MAIPWPPDEPPDPEIPPPGQLAGLGRFLRRRYTCNVAVTDQLLAVDLLNDVIFVGSRMFMTQAANGKLSLKNKKPASWAMGTDQFSATDTVLPVDNVADWIGNVDNWLLIAPHTTSSEIRRVTDAEYSTAQNSIALSATDDDGGVTVFAITGFSGCDGDATPATGVILVDNLPADGTTCTVTVDTTTFTFMVNSSDTLASISSYIAGVIASHPSLYRRFSVVWDEVDTVTLTARFGNLTLESAIANTTDAPITDPVTAPTLAASGTSTTFLAGSYAVAYSYVNGSGETLLSEFKSITITATQKIDVTAITPLPAGVDSVNWYVSPEPDSTKLRYIANNAGGAFSITTLPLLSAQLPPDLNRTGCEVMRVAAVFSDRTVTRSAASRSNVIKATYSWLLGNREKSVNRIDLKYRDASDDYRLVELRLRDDAHIEKTKKVSNLEINGQAIDNTDQAYRITAGLLAEKRDADFFYKWEATREALLLQEGDVVAITDDGSGVFNLPVRLEQIEFDLNNASLPVASFTARKYSSTLFDDSIVERTIPVVAEASEPDMPMMVDALIVAGGGGGGAAYGGGGGAGGVKYLSAYSVAAGTYTVTVGSGGAGSPAVGVANVGTNGSNSVFDTTTATGGGGGAGYLPVSGPGNAGRSGGGGVYGGVGGAGTTGQGFAGGNGNAGGNIGGGGGGGAGAIGTNGGTNGGDGGTGVAFSISGASVTYGGGGGGGVFNAGAGGSGGSGGGGAGGATAASAGSNATANTGGGGGGGGYSGTTKAGGNGGSGVVIVRDRTERF